MTMKNHTDLAPSGVPWQVTRFESSPPVEKWDDWVEWDAAAWPRRVERRYTLVPTVCFNCEAACGLVAYVDKQSNRIRKLEGNPHHPGSRGRNCAKGPATLNQVDDPERILYPLKRSGPRGSGRFERTTWDEVIATFAARIRRALVEGARLRRVWGTPCGPEAIAPRRIMRERGSSCSCPRISRPATTSTHMRNASSRPRLPVPRSLPSTYVFRIRPR
jgi:anaerobic selenocysteine-containing dehydrogenase